MTTHRLPAAASTAASQFHILKSCKLSHSSHYTTQETIMNTIDKEKVSEEIIKPASPTPIHLRNYTLSLLDNHLPSVSISFVLLYQKCITSSVVAAAGDDDEVRVLRLLQQLKKSLSESLNHYYPLAGRLSDDEASVDCNDSGVEFVTARIKCDLSEILKRPDPEALRRLFFHSDVSRVSINNSNNNNVLLSIQASFLNCGGMGIGVSVLHKVADASSIIHFLRHWSSLTASGSRQEIGPPLMNASSIFPGNVIGNFVLDKGNDVVTKRFVFSSSTLAALKKEKTNTILVDHHRGVGDVDEHYQQRCINPTRVQLVSALILKSATVAASRAAGGHLLNPKACWSQAVNLRERMKPSLPATTFGNIIWPLHIIISKPDDFDATLSNLREGLIEFNAMELLKNRGQVCASMLSHATEVFTSNQTTNLVYTNSSWCRFPIYQVDFGWGSPVWVGLNMDVAKNTIYLMDTPKAKGDDVGIEAWISLERQEMELFQLEEDILAYASLNPSALPQQEDSSSS